MADIDLHTHTRFFHGFAGRPTWYDEIGSRLHVAVARLRGLDGIAVTNHDYHTGFEFDTGDLTIVPGIEISSTDGHLLVVGPDPPRRTNPNVLSPTEVVDLAHARDCAVVLAHPYRNSRIKDMNVAVDAVEVNGKRIESPSMVEDLAAVRDLPLVGGSDAHYPIEVGRAYTEVDADSITPESMVDAIRAGDTHYRLVDRFPDRYLKRVYSLVHRLKGHTGSTPASPAPGRQASGSDDAAESQEPFERRPPD